MPKPTIPIKPPYTPELLPIVQYAIEGILGKGGEVFEYGSGYSTLWFAKFASVISVEDDEEWYKELQKALKKAKLDSEPIVHLVEPDKMSETIDDYELFDLVLVDCRDDQRMPAVVRAIPHVKIGGWLLLDDSHWPNMAHIQDYLKGWSNTTISGRHHRHWTHHGAVRDHQTSFYQRPL